jgi:phage gpG-like protein
VSVTPEENLEILIKAFSQIDQGAVAAATAMAKFIRDRARNDTLQRSYHAPGAFNRQKPGRPPARASGALADHMYSTPAYGGIRATAMAGNDSDYGRIHEFGCVITPKNGVYLGWQDTGRPDNPSGIWRHRSVNLPPHPFLSVTTDESVDDGSLQEAAIEAFRPYDP